MSMFSRYPNRINQVTLKKGTLFTTTKSRRKKGRIDNIRTKQAGHAFACGYMRATFLGYLHTRRQDNSTAGGRRKPKACSWLEQALAPRRSRRPAPLFQEIILGIALLYISECGAATPARSGSRWKYLLSFF